jgi:hypothetical protein
MYLVTPGYNNNNNNNNNNNTIIIITIIYSPSGEYIITAFPNLITEVTTNSY